MNFIDWCANNDVPFAQWLEEVYPEKRRGTDAAQQARRDRATGAKGRPRNDTS